MRNHNVQHLLPATFIIMALMGGAADAQAQTWVQAGMLRCRLNPSIGFVIFGHQSMECGFQPVSGPVQAYEGAINTVYRRSQTSPVRERTLNLGMMVAGDCYTFCDTAARILLRSMRPLRFVLDARKPIK